MHDAVYQGNRLINAATKRPLTPVQITRPLAVFCHGWASHGLVLTALSEAAMDDGYCAAVYEYDPYAGIVAASDRLLSLLDKLNARDVMLIGHSMGGLVARAAALSAPSRRRPSALVLVGTPNNGIRVKQWRFIVTILGRLLDARAGKAKLGARQWRRCTSTRELLCVDERGTIEAINDQHRRHPLVMPIMSISGGRRALDRPALDGTIQALLPSGDNDGIVPETSANITALLGTLKGLYHERSYTTWKQHNHNDLLNSHEVALIMLRFLHKIRAGH